MSLHGHNEAARVARGALGWLAEGRRWRVVSDAGTPAVSDPGRRLVAAAAVAPGYVVTEVPGPLVGADRPDAVSGLATDRFCVEGFLPRKGPERRRRLAALADEERTAVVLEAPGRVAATLADLAEACGDRPVAVCRELTKLHEEVWRGSARRRGGQFAEREAAGARSWWWWRAPHRPAGPDDAAESTRPSRAASAAATSAREAAEAVRRGPRGAPAGAPMTAAVARARRAGG